MRQPLFFGDIYAPSAVGAGAAISPCGLYRYTLWRHWGDGARRVNFVMLNPSVADAVTTDPTMTRCVGFARTWGFDGLVITNLYALRATDPKDLWKAADPVGPENDAHLEREARAAALVVCGWGNGGSPVWRKDGWHRGRGPVVLRKLEEWGVAAHALRVTAEGQPTHPLYLPAGLTPKTLDEAPRPEIIWSPAGFDPREYRP